MSQIELVDQNNNKVGHIDASDFLPKAKFDKLLVAEVVKYQLAKSATSSGANFEESQAGSSKADFNNKVRISL